MTDELVVLMGDRVAGRLHRPADHHGGPELSLTFRYDEAYRRRADATPLSATLPTCRALHDGSTVSAWFENLLPDHVGVLSRWSRTFQASALSPLSLLSTPIGRDCAGAVRFARPHDASDEADPPAEPGPLGESALAEVLRDLRKDPTTWLGRHGDGEFTLSGSQAKTVLSRSGAGWARPGVPVPSTHVVKVGLPGFPDHDLNEYLCLTAARACRMDAAQVSVLSAEGEHAIAVTRFDRTQAVDGTVLRVHQEDLCQATGYRAGARYQSDGGPGTSEVARFLHDHGSSDDVGRFTEALIFNWLIGGTDAHAKNYALLLSGTQVRLAPLYDIGSALAYPGMHIRKLRLAMKFGGDYSLLARGPAVWARLATDVGLAEDDVVTRARRLVRDVPEAFAEAASAPEVKELGSDLPARLVDAVAERAVHCASALP